MATHPTPARRWGKDLFLATRPLAVESRRRSWWATISTFAILISLLAGAGFAPWWPLKLALSVLGGLVLVRAFVLYHDFQHGAILRHSLPARWLFYAFGLVALTPPKYWRYSHNFHHAHVGKPIPTQEGTFSLLTDDVGAIPLMTTGMWQHATWRQRLHYRISRHPLTILCAYITVFLFSITLLPTLKNPRRFWDGAVSIVLHVAMIALLWSLGGFSFVFFACLLPAVIASSLGAYLFFAQHNCEHLKILPADQWSHFQASLDSSSYMKLGALGKWFTANIGYHHVHHLNSLIPFYRLPEAMAAIPELQSPIVTTLRPRDVFTCFQLSLWDMASQRLVTRRQAREAPSIDADHARHCGG